MTGSRPANWLLSLLALGAILTVGPAPARAAEAPLRVAVTFPAERSAQPIDGRLLLLVSTATEGEPRLQVNDTARTAQVFGVDVEAWKPGEPRVVDATAFGYPLRSLAGLPKGTYLVQAMVNRYETFTRGDGVTVKLPPDKGEGQQWARKPGNLYSTPRRMVAGSGVRSARPSGPRPGSAAGRRLREAGDGLRQVRAGAQRAAVDVLGPRHVPRRVGPAALGFRRSSRRAVSAGDQPRALPGEFRGLAGDASGPRSEARLQRALPAGRLQPDPAGAGASVLQGLDRAGIPARAADRDPASHAVLRRLVRRELGQQRAVRRRDHVRAGARDRTPLPRPRAGMGAVHLRRIDRRLGSHGRADVLPGRVQRRVGRLPRSDRFPPLHRRQSLRRRERVLPGGAVQARAAARAAQLPGTRHHDARADEPPRAGAWRTDALRRSVGRLGIGVLAARGRRLPEADLEQAHRPDRQGGRRVLARELRLVPHPSTRLGRRSGPSCAASCASTSATWTTTT